MTKKRTGAKRFLLLLALLPTPVGGEQDNFARQNNSPTLFGMREYRLLAGDISQDPANSALVEDFPSGNAATDDLKARLMALLTGHVRINKVLADRKSAWHGARQAMGDWFPALDINLTMGGEQQRKTDQAHNTNDFDETEIKISQLLWDFGATNGKVAQGRLRYEKANIEWAAARQKLLLEALTAFLEWKKAKQTVEFVRRSEANVHRQTELELTRTTGGAGSASDVLQSKTQLAGARSRRIQAESALDITGNRYRALFGEFPPDTLFSAKLPPSLLAKVPKTLDGTLTLALLDNSEVRAAILDERIAKQKIRAVHGKQFFPRIEASAGYTKKDGADGIPAIREDTFVDVSVNFPLNLMSGTNALRAARQQRVAALYEVTNVQHSVEEKARNNWQRLSNSRIVADSLDEQARYAAEFLALARMERELGNRSLIDLLSGENSLNNAQNAAASARIDLQLAQLALLHVIGRLDLDEAFNVGSASP
ncbi:MAG: TolC family protein [Gammaproteobacteria bacterium]|nr:TolC family protein [Gammaproteobacteria bacterium]